MHAALRAVLRVIFAAKHVIPLVSLFTCAHFVRMKERELELNNLKDEMSALRKNTGEATDQKNTWATKYEALERNFKQVSEHSVHPRICERRSTLWEHA